MNLRELTDATLELEVKFRETEGKIRALELQLWELQANISEVHADAVVAMPRWFRALWISWLGVQQIVNPR